MILTAETIDRFKEYLIEDEKSENTIEKYMRDTSRFMCFTGGKKMTKELVKEYKQSLIDDVRGYAERSINSMLISVNCLLDFLGRSDCKVKTLKIQQDVFAPEDKELTKAEFDRLVDTAERTGKRKIALIIKTICGTGIRVSELKYITVEAVKSGTATVRCKGKTRKIFIVKELRKQLMKYAKRAGIKGGAIFLDSNGNPIRRTSIWREMKKLCREAGVKESKVFPHNLRHLFARTYYKLHKDVVRLADILGHSSVNTTRIYTASSGAECRRNMEMMQLVI